MIRNSIKYLYSFLVSVLLLSSCKKCDNDCNNGYCYKGVCECIEGWEGDACLNQSTPTNVVVDSIVIHTFPQLKTDGTPWDTTQNQENPDLILWWYFGSANSSYPDYITDEVFENATNDKAYSFTKDFPMKIPMSDFNKQSNLYVSDDDPANNTVQILGGYYFWLYYNKNEFPKEMTLAESGYHTSFTLYLSYEF